MESQQQQIVDSEVVIRDLQGVVERLQSELCQYQTSDYAAQDISPMSPAATAAQERRKKREKEMQRVRTQLQTALFICLERF